MEPTMAHVPPNKRCWLSSNGTSDAAMSLTRVTSLQPTWRQRYLHSKENLLLQTLHLPIETPLWCNAG